ncbi:F-box domain-containing protein [Mycena venus]|uniref:F-box domain-containing protein n=1 Tax=Mycena venus TaxID=2733690 RepID=A0A8H6YHV4_9AGAR|nr:F-box domain-containing protein [Mycena venus]
MANFLCPNCGFQPQNGPNVTGTDAFPITRDIQRARLASLTQRIAQINRNLEAVQTERRAVEKELSLITFSILSIPNELTTEIFRHCLPDHGRVRHSTRAVPFLLMQVCRRWREIALGMGDLWKSVDMFLENYVDYDAKRLGDIVEWFPRAAGRPLSLTIRSDVGRSVNLPPSLFTSISAFQSQLSRLELCIPPADFENLNQIGNYFPQLYHLSLSLCRFPPVEGVTTAFQNLPSLRELCLDKGISLSNVEIGSAPLLMSLEVAHNIAFQDFFALTEKFPMLAHVKTYPASNSWHSGSEKPTLSLRSLDFGPYHHSFDRMNIPTLQRLGFSLAYSLNFSEFALRSACVLQDLTLYLSDGDTWLLQDCLRDVPTLTTLRVESMDHSARMIFPALSLSSRNTLPSLRVLTVCLPGPADFSSVFMAASNRRALRKLRLRLDIQPDGFDDNFEDGGWLPEDAWVIALESLEIDIYVETPGGNWPDLVEYRCSEFPGRITQEGDD